MSLVGLQAQHALLAVSVCVAEGGDAPQAIISVDSCLAKRRPFCGFKKLKPVGFCVICAFCGNYKQRNYKYNYTLIIEPNINVHYTSYKLNVHYTNIRTLRTDKQKLEVQI